MVDISLEHFVGSTEESTQLLHGKTVFSLTFLHVYILFNNFDYWNQPIHNTKCSSIYDINIFFETLNQQKHLGLMNIKYHSSNNTVYA
jgi:hypothetical protein